MTNTDWLNEIVPEVSQGIKNAIMTARGVDPQAAYSSNQSIELVEADIYMRMTIMPEFSEGSLSIKYDRSSLREQANTIYEKWGDDKYTSGKPTIKRVKL
ncbi:DUF6706 family protein [Zunongwangia sp.]|uniref:DUF6706 family protein n=1 Tax=Zunongwangia sp. TaxID=1965325 RepID=UPI003AA962CF